MSAIVGPNGAGKSTFLKAALGLVPAVSGEVRIFGRPLSEARDRIAYGRQRASNRTGISPTTVIDVVPGWAGYRKLGLFRRVSKAERAVAARGAWPASAWRVSRTARSGQLSGGQQQRVLLAPRLAQEPTLPLDESFAVVECGRKPRRANHRGAEIAQGAGQSRWIAVQVMTVDRPRAYFDHVFLVKRSAPIGARGPVPCLYPRAPWPGTYGVPAGTATPSRPALRCTGGMNPPMSEAFSRSRTC